MQDAASGDGTVAKALEILDQVAGYGRPVRFRELQDHSPYPKATLYRLLQTLTRQGMIRFDPERGDYALGVRLVRLAHQAWRQSSLAPIARPHVEALAHAVQETVHLAQLDNAQVLYVDKRNAAEPVEMYSQAGKVGPVYCTGIGKAMLAFLPPEEQKAVVAQQSFHRFTETTLTDPDLLAAELVRIRARGHAYDDEEHEPGIICVALPILSETGRVLGGISVTSTTERRALADLAGLAPKISETSERIARDVSHWRFPDEDRRFA